MNLKDYKPTLHNDISIDDEEIYKQHTNIINQKKYNEATALLSENPQISGCTASLLNSWEEKIESLEPLILAKDFYDPYYYTSTEPSVEEIDDKVIWQQEY